MHCRSFFTVALFIAALPLGAQESRVITGTILDASNKHPLPFTSVGLKKQLAGTVSNEEGKFDLLISHDAENDTLIINSFGFRKVEMPVRSITQPVTISVQPDPVLLQEIEVRPLTPETYILMAMRRLNQNYAKDPFQSVAYYREKVLENKEFIKMDEGVFKTFCPAYLDTTKSQDQLMLFRSAENVRSVAFMSKERKKAEEKEKKTGKKDDSTIDLDLTSSFGGPAGILKSSRISGKSLNFLDTTDLKEYKYTFAKGSSHGNSELLVIDFKSRGKVEHVRESGRIFIDPGTYAIIKIEHSGSFVIPVLIRPLIFFYGYGIDNPVFASNVEFQQVGNRWYPRNMLMNIDIELTRRHMFSKNEHSLFEIEQAYVVNSYDIEKPSPIAPEKRFITNKKMSEQVYNDDKLRWENINIIKQ